MERCAATDARSRFLKSKGPVAAGPPTEHLKGILIEMSSLAHEDTPSRDNSPRESHRWRTVLYVLQGTAALATTALAITQLFWR